MLDRRAFLVGGGAALATAALPARSAAARRTDKWADLRTRIQGDVVLPSDTGYDFAKQGVLKEFDAVNPQGIVYCETPADVQTTIRFARTHGLPARTRSGGHNLAGWSTTEGVVIDVSRIRHVSAGSTVRLGPGAQSIDALSTLAPQGKQIVTGTCPTVCPGGFLSGGGIGLQSRKFGIGSDRLVSAKVVLADGRLVYTDAATRPDLFWALRGGGGNNFGIVVEFEVRPISAPRLVFFDTTWPWDRAREVVAAWQEWCATGPDDLGSTLAVLLPDAAPGAVPIVQISGGFHGDPAVLERLLNDLASASGATPTSRKVQDLPYDQGMKQVYGCGDFTVQECHRVGTNPQAKLERASWMRERSRLLNRPLGDQGTADLLAAFDTDRRAGQFRNLYFMALGGAANRVGRTETAYVHRGAQFFVACATILGTPTPTAEEAQAAMAWPVRGYNVINPLSSGESYLNFPNPDIADWRQAYYAENYPRLLEAKRCYDPGNFFKHPQSIGA